jgi:hypothetical protein
MMNGKAAASAPQDGTPDRIQASREIDYVRAELPVRACHVTCLFRWPVLLQVGLNGSSANHAANPTTIQDVFIRIGGAGPGSATTSVVVNSNNAVIDHILA